MGDKTTERLDYYFYTWEVIDKIKVPIDYVYVGSTACIRQRKSRYKSAYNTKKAQQPIVRYLIEYGWDSFEMKVIGTEKQLTKTEARIKEQEYIDKIKYRPNGACLNATSAYSLHRYTKSGCVTHEQHLEQKEFILQNKLKKQKYILDIITNSKIHNIEYTQKSTGEVHKIEYYGLIASQKQAITIYYMKRNWDKVLYDEVEDVASKEVKEWYEYNCPMIRTELFDNRDKKMVIKYLKELVNDMETE